MSLEREFNIFHSTISRWGEEYCALYGKTRFVKDDMRCKQKNAAPVQMSLFDDDAVHVASPNEKPSKRSKDTIQSLSQKIHNLQIEFEQVDFLVKNMRSKIDKSNRELLIYFVVGMTAGAVFMSLFPWVRG